ncbi:MAG: polymer-forming cytoskeletal protein [Verrucomicrobiota bacterium]|nr:polymer-forming cytoskeletal protein [Verrucomicrobiota bacterium]
MCRQCGAAFSPAAPTKAELKLRAPHEQVAAAVASLADGPGLMRKFDGLFGKQRSSTVECFDCKAKQEVTSAASSTTCPKCSAHLDLRDYKITTSFSRAIRTHGEVHVTARGDLSSSNVVCTAALIEGKVRGNLTCTGTVTVNCVGKIPGRITAVHVLVDRKADVQFFRRLQVKSLEVRGRMTGEVIAETVVVIHRNASLDGDVTAKSISVEKDGLFSGQLVIGSSGLMQGELLPMTDSADALVAAAPVRPAGDQEFLPGIVPPLPAA